MGPAARPNRPGRWKGNFAFFRCWPLQSGGGRRVERRTDICPKPNSLPQPVDQSFVVRGPHEKQQSAPAGILCCPPVWSSKAIWSLLAQLVFSVAGPFVPISFEANPQNCGSFFCGYSP